MGEETGEEKVLQGFKGFLAAVLILLAIGVAVIFVFLIGLIALLILLPVLVALLLIGALLGPFEMKIKRSELKKEE